MRFLTFILFITVSHILLAQEGISVIDGKLLDDETGEPIPYASIGIVGHTFGTSSNLDGLFSLKIPSTIKLKNASIKISCIGYESVTIENPENTLYIRLKPSTTKLREVLVFGKDLSPEGIVKRAFRNISKNYNTKPFLYQNFYRHYCKDDSIYGRLIEAAVDVYKKKGYKVQSVSPAARDQVRVTQLRRSFDNTKVSSGHVPIALYSIMSNDLVAYQQKNTSPLTFLYRNDVSSLRKKSKEFDFYLEGTTEYDGETVYKISYKLRKDSIVYTTGLSVKNGQEGMLYITATKYAIVRAEHDATNVLGNVHQVVNYKKLNDKYYPYHLMKEGNTFYLKQNFTHVHHLEFITTDIITKGYSKFNGREPDKVTLLKIDYDSGFWKSYNILKETPLEESIVADLEKQQNLDGQFKDFVTSQRERFFSGKEDEEKFNDFLKNNMGKRPILIDFWASWCKPCLKEMPASMDLLDKYKGKVAFVYLSIDEDIDAWKTALKKFNLEKPFLANHFRIGPRSDAAILYDVSTIPRYILIDKHGKYFDQNAKRPSDPELERDLDRLLAESIEK